MGLSANGLPMGIEIDGLPNGDTKLLDLAARISNVLGPSCSILPRGYRTSSGQFLRRQSDDAVTLRSR
jgi:hypothetical protein